MLRLFVGRRQKLGGFEPRFPLYPAETHLCGCQKRRRRTNVENKNSNPKTSMKPNLNRFAAILLFASAAIICSLTMWATPTVTGLPAPLGKTGAIGEAPKVGASHSPFGTVTHCVGADPAQIVFPFADDYSCVGLGAVPGLPNPYGGLTFKYDDPNTLLIGGAANSSADRIYQVGVIRDANMHITGFSGAASVYPIAQAAIGQFSDGGVAFGPQNVLFVTRYPANQVEQSKLGSSAPDKVVDLSPLGVGASTGSIGFVPAGFPGAGSMKIVSFTGGGWYHADFVPDGNGTFNITSASLRATLPNGAGPEGIAFVPPGSPVFPSNSVLIALHGLGKVVTAPLDANGDPILANAQDVLQQLGHPDGACIDPVTGDFLLGSFSAKGQLIRVSGFEAPTPTPTATVTPIPTATATATPRATATATTKRDTTSVSAALVSITLNPGNLTGNANSTGTVTLSAAAPAGGAVVMLASNKPAATVPISVTVAAGATTATFTVHTTTVTAGTIAMITATYDGISKQVGLVVNTLLGSLTFNPSVLIGGANSTGTVTLNSAAPAGGAVVTLTSGNPTAVPVPAPVTVAPGATSASFPVTTNPVTTVTQVNITATSLGASRISTMTLNPPAALNGVSVNPTAVTGNAGSTGTVTLGSAAPVGGAVVTLTSSNPAATVPVSVTVPAGATTKNFAVNTIGGTVPTAVTITATYNNDARTATPTVKPAASAHVGVPVNPTAVTGNAGSTGTVTLGSAAPVGGAVVTLTSSNPAATVQGTVTVAAGATTKNFAVNTIGGTVPTAVTIKATYNNVARTATLPVNHAAAALVGVSVNPTAVTGNAGSNGTVTVNRAEPAGGRVVTVTSRYPR